MATVAVMSERSLSFPSHISSGCPGMISEDTAVPFPYRDRL
ncbi:hypothetical protein [Microcoleus vaginatus]